MFNLAAIIIALCPTIYLIVDRICEVKEAEIMSENEKDIEDEEN